MIVVVGCWVYIHAFWFGVLFQILLFEAKGGEGFLNRVWGFGRIKYFWGSGLDFWGVGKKVEDLRMEGEELGC